MSADATFSDLCEGPKLKEGWLEKRERKGFVAYYVMLKSKFIFFFNGEKKEDNKKYLGYIELTPSTECLPRKSKKSKHKWDFELRIDARRIFLFRLKSEVTMTEWISAIYKALKKEPRPMFNTSFEDEAAGFLSYRALADDNNQGVVHRRVPIRRETIPGNSGAARQTIQRQISGDMSDVPSSITPDTDAIGYDPVVLYFRWYYPTMTRQEAEDVLLKQEVGTYLLRDSESARYRDFYTLSFRDKDRIKHHKIEPRQSGQELKYVFHGDERIDFKTPGDAVVFLMSSKQTNFPTKPYMAVRSTNNLKPIFMERERTSGDGMEGKLNLRRDDEYLTPVSNNEYLRRRVQMNAVTPEENSARARRSKSSSELPDVPFPALPTSDQLEQGLFGDYQNFDAVKLNSMRFKNLNLRDQRETLSSFHPSKKSQGSTYVNMKS